MSDYNPWYEEQMRKNRMDNLEKEIKRRDAVEKLPSVLHDADLQNNYTSNEIASLGNFRLDDLLAKYTNAIEIIELAWGDGLSGEAERYRQQTYDLYKTMAKKLREEKVNRDKERKKQEIIGKYDQLIQEMNKASTESEFQHLTTQFRNMEGYKDANHLANECVNRQQVLEQQQKARERERLTAIEARDKTCLFLILGVFGVGQFMLWEFLFLGIGLSDSFYFHIYELVIYNDNGFAFFLGFIPIAIFSVIIGILTLQRRYGHKTAGLRAIWAGIISMTINALVFDYRYDFGSTMSDYIIVSITLIALGLIVSIPAFIMIKSTHG